MLPPALRFGAWIIAGPTGVGKSTLAVRVAERCRGEIIGADTAQIYAGLPILTAQPSAELRARVPHHLIGTVPPGQPFDVAQYLRLATERLEEIRARGRQPIVVGGAGLYLRALLSGLAALPPADAALRAELEAKPLAELQEQLRALDPATTVDLQNPRRVVRALEVCLLTGRPFSAFRQEWTGVEPPLQGVWLDREPAALQRRIEERVEAMFREGVEEEVRAAGDVGPGLEQALGFREIRALLKGENTRAECQDKMRLVTRQYTKRQRTWFRKEPALWRMVVSD